MFSICAKVGLMELVGRETKKKKIKTCQIFLRNCLIRLSKSHHYSTVDYLNIGCVCRRWRLFAKRYEKEIMASQPPLALFLSSVAIFFYSIFDQSLYKAILPSPLSQQHECFGDSLVVVGTWCFGTRGRGGKILNFGYYILLQNMNFVSVNLQNFIIVSY